MVTFILMWIDVPLTFAFGYGGASLVKKIPNCKNVIFLLIAGLVLAGVYTFAGGIARDWVILRVSIGAFSRDCIECWISLELGGLVYLFTHGCLVCKKRTNTGSFQRSLIEVKSWMGSHPTVDKMFGLVETWGVYKFILAAVDRAVAVDGTRLFLQALSGFSTGTLGGLISNVFVRKGHIREIIMERRRYYSNVALLSLGYVFLRRYSIGHSEWDPLIVATGWQISLELVHDIYWVLFALDCRLNKGRGGAYRIKIGLELTVGAMFRSILRPGKGFRTLSLIPNSMGQGADNFIVEESA